MSFPKIDKDLLKKAFRLMCLTRAAERIYQENHSLTNHYLYSSSRGHEALQIATAFHLKPYDFVAPYYRDEALLLGLGVPLEDLMMQLTGKKSSLSTGKNPYVLNPVKQEGLPSLLFTGDGTGMHIIPATGVAQGLTYLAGISGMPKSNQSPMVVCSLGDGAIPKGETAEALQMALLKKLPVLYLVQDNDWMASTPAESIRVIDAYEFAGGFRGMKRSRVNGADFVQAYESIGAAIEYIRTEHLPVLLQVKTPLLTSHSSVLKRESYRTEEDMELHRRDEPITRIKKYLTIEGASSEEIETEEREAELLVKEIWSKITGTADDDTNSSNNSFFLPSPVEQPSGIKEPVGGITINFRQTAIRTIESFLADYQEAIVFGEEVGSAEEYQNMVRVFGKDRVFSTPAVPAYLAGAAAGLSWTGCKPVVVYHSSESLLSGIGQLANMVAKANYLSDGKFSVQALWRVETGSYPESSPYESASIESILVNIKGLKVVYPSNASDLKGLLKTAFVDPNPVIILEHRGLFQADFARSIEPSHDYYLPFGKCRIVQHASEEQKDDGYTCVVITYGMGVHIAQKASLNFPGSVEIIDLLTLSPLDFEGIVTSVKQHNKALILTEESLQNSFAESLAGRITQTCFRILDAPVQVVGAEEIPALPMNKHQKQAILPDTHKVAEAIGKLLNY
jgi:2-oxoisovalerate dehydrogenase E1 component